MKRKKDRKGKRKIQFKNSKGRVARTTLSDEIMVEIANLTEKTLVENNIYFLRDGTKFQVKSNNVDDLLSAQTKANLTMLDSGKLTPEMLINDFFKNI